MSQKMVKQTRRSISVRGITYDTLRQHCDDVNRSMSDVIEELLASLFTKAGLAVEAAKPQKTKTKGGKVAPLVAAEKTRKLSAPSSRRNAIANRVARMPHVSPEEAEAIRRKYSIPTGNEKTTQMGRPAPTPVSSYVKAERPQPAPSPKDHRGIRF